MNDHSFRSYSSPAQPGVRSSFRERGQSLIEFAFSLVLLLILVAGVVDGGRALFTYLAMRDAAQEGASYASVNPSDSAGINQRTRQSSNLLEDLGASISVTVSPTVSGKLCAGTTGGIDHGIKVRINYPHFPLTMPFIGAFVGSADQTIPISVEVTDAIIIPKCK